MGVVRLPKGDDQIIDTALLYPHKLIRPGYDVGRKFHVVGLNCRSCDVTGSTERKGRADL